MKPLTGSQIWALVLGGSALLACGSNPASAGDEYLAGAPEESALQLGITDDANSEGQATASDAVDATEQVAQSITETSAALPGSVAPELAHCREAVHDLNQALRSFMQPIVALVRDTTPDTSVAHVKVWGPVTRGATEFRFVMRRGQLRHFGWLLEARPAGTSEAFTNVAAGSIIVGYTARRGIGSVGIDLDALGALDPTVVARGSLLASFAHGPNGSTLAYRLRGFTTDPAQNPGIDALIQGVHLKAGVNHARLAYYGNVTGTASDLPELVLARARHLRNIGGRADLLATGGDIVEGKVWVISECWNAGLKSAYRIVSECPIDGVNGNACTAVSTTGDPSACVPAVADLALPPSDANAPLSDPEIPEADVTPPTAMPDGSAP